MTEDVIARIDTELGCQYCGLALKMDGPSADFCDEPCAMRWHAKQADPIEAKKRPPDQPRRVLLAPPRPVEASDSAEPTELPAWQRGWLSRWFGRHR